MHLIHKNNQHSASVIPSKATELTADERVTTSYARSRVFGPSYVPMRSDELDIE